MLALAAAQVLYMFAWFRSSGEILRENVRSAAELFERSIHASDCRPAQPYEALRNETETGPWGEVWNENACVVDSGLKKERA